jgi:prepilin-type N-terminal cleavage/methylation domain-containing protein
MVIKYTILKVLTQNSSKVRNSKTGFTLIELIVGLVIMVIVGGLAMNAFIQASKNFSDDKKNIDSSQNLSAVLEVIGNDIKQSGEQINEFNFPVIKIEPAGSGSMSGSSKITIRRALTTPLTLCETIAAGSMATALTVADNSIANANCQVGTLVSTTTPVVTRPTLLKEARDYRCKLDDINGDYTDATRDFCFSGSTTEKVLAAMSDGAGNLRLFRYLDDDESSPNIQYRLTTEQPLSNSFSTSTPNVVTYATGSPIYLIEERTYSLDPNGNLQLERDASGTRETLIKGIQSFKVSARVYGDTTTKAADPIDNPGTTAGAAPSVLPHTRRCDPTIAYYICDFNSTTVDNWKTLQGIKVELQAKYDASGGNSTASANDVDKLSAKAEFFPRNVLSK